MSRILAGAQPAPPRFGCILLRCRLGARGRDSSTSRPFTQAERIALEKGLSWSAGRLLEASSLELPQGLEPSSDGSVSRVFFVDPKALSAVYGGEYSWARCVTSFVYARGFGVSVAVASSAEEALQAANARWGVSVVPVNSSAEAISRTGVSTGQSASPSPDSHPGLRAVPAGPAQLGLPGVVLGRTKRRSPQPARVAPLISVPKVA